MQNVAIFGGTFNPVHWGHLLMAEAALSQAQLDQVIWVPTRQPPQKAIAHVLAMEYRLEMIRRAIAPHPNFVLSTVELNRAGPSYAMATLTDLQQIYPQRQWFWLIGLDAFQSLPRWYQRQTLAAQCKWLIAPRFAVPASPLDCWGQASEASHDHLAQQAAQQVARQVTQEMAAQGLAVRWQLLDLPLVDISSSRVRRYCRDRRSIRYLVPESVRDYITKYGLYQASFDPHQ